MRIRVNTQSNNEVIAVGIQGPAGPPTSGTSNNLNNLLNELSDVNSTNLSNGSVLVYKTNTSKWTSTTTLDAQNMEGGEF